MRQATIENMQPRHFRALTRAMDSLLGDKLKVRLDDKTIGYLKPHANTYEKFLESRKNLTKQRDMLTRDQRGGFAFLLPIIGSVLASAAAEGVGALVRAIKKK